jgi:hypothetical protein
VDTSYKTWILCRFLESNFLRKTCCIWLNAMLLCFFLSPPSSQMNWQWRLSSVVSDLIHPFLCSYWRDSDICFPLEAFFSVKWRMVTSILDALLDKILSICSKYRLFFQLCHHAPFKNPWTLNEYHTTKKGQILVLALP